LIRICSIPVGHGGDRRQVRRDAGAQRRPRLAQPELEQGRDPHQDRPDLGAGPGCRLGGDRELAQVRDQGAEALGLLDDVAREVQHLLQLDLLLLEQQLRQALDGEQGLAQLVDLLRGKTPELRQAAGRGQQLAQPADLGR
jgi:hypothetical protein